MNNIINILKKNNISGHTVQNREGKENITCSYNLHSYIITKEDDNFKLLESNSYSNFKRKNRYHQINKLFENIDSLIQFIKSRNIYVFI